MSEYMTVKKLATALHCSEGTIYNRLSQGKDMPPSIQVGRRRLFPIEEFKEWMRKHTKVNEPISLLNPLNGEK